MLRRIDSNIVDIREQTIYNSKAEERRLILKIKVMRRFEVRSWGTLQPTVSVAAEGVGAGVGWGA
jgi:hypothetical protein